jgi:hypothetical protein
MKPETRPQKSRPKFWRKNEKNRIGSRFWRDLGRLRSRNLSLRMACRPDACHEGAPVRTERLRVG